MFWLWLPVVALVVVAVTIALAHWRERRSESDPRSVVPVPLSGSSVGPPTIGPYKVVERLSQSDTSVIYRVESPEGQPLALKQPLPELWNDPETSQRFLREIRIATSLRHPNLVQIVAVNDGQDRRTGQPFIAMEWVAGVPLSTLLTSGTPQTIDNVVAIGVLMLNALVIVHQHGVIHRDVKPANIMITPAGQAKLMDFGIAKKVGADLTRSGEMLGTGMYMAPEALQGQADFRTDIYALGTVLYEMAAGLPPFAESNLVGLVMAKASQETPPLAERISTLPPRLEQVIMRMVARRPENRYATATEALRDLKSIGRGTETFQFTEKRGEK